MFENITNFFDLTFWQKMYFIGTMSGIGAFIWILSDTKKYLKWIDEHEI